MTSDDANPTTTMITDLLDVGVQLGRDMLAAVRSAQPAARSVQVVRRGAATLPLSRLTPSMQSCGCDIPPPCWMPRELGKVVSHGCPGATAQVRLRITNCGLGSRSVKVAAQGGGSDKVTLDPQSLALSTFEQGTVTASLSVPEQGSAPIDVLLWVRGCKDHVLRWRVDVSDDGCSSLHEVDVQDCPDLIHHWYDHFYCVRPCDHENKVVRRHG